MSFGSMSISRVYTVTGVCIGTLLVIFSSLVAVWQQGLELTFGAMLQVQEALALLWIIDCIAFVIATTLIIAGKNFEKQSVQYQKNQYLSAQIKQRDTDLALLVHHRTAQLNQRLRSVEEESLRKMEYLANISQKNRAPLNGVVGMLGLLNDTDLSDLQKEYMTTLNNSVHTLVDFVNDIVDYSKIESDQLRFNDIDFTLLLLLEDIIDIYSAAAKDKGLQFHVDICEKLPAKLRADSTRLRQILNIIFSNSVKFTQNGEITFRVSQKYQKNGNVELCFTISDTGMGMSEEQLDRLFLNQEQKTKTEHRQVNNSGLEIGIAHELVGMFGGRLSATSTLTQGSTFQFSIIASIANEVNSVIAVKPVLQHSKILLISDNQTIVSSLTTSLNRYIENVVHVRADAWHKQLEDIAKKPTESDWYDVVIIEQMSVTETYQDIIKKINSMIDRGQVKFLLLALSGQRGEAEEAANAGVNAYLSMPFSSEQLVEMLAKLLGQPGRNQLITKHTLEEDDFKPNRVLVVEDSLANQFAAKAILLKMGMTVDVVENGRDAIDYSFRHQYKLVLMDCHLPDMDGFEAARKIRVAEQEKSTRPVPIIAMSVDVHPNERQQGIDSGMDDFITKPVTEELLDNTLKRWLKKAS